MSGRGRGRGRGRGAGPGQGGRSNIPGATADISYATLFPPIAPVPFPEIELNPPRDLSEEELEIVELNREFLKQIHKSPFYFDKIFAKKLSTISTNLQFFPEELHSVYDTKAKLKKRKVIETGIDLSTLTELEREELAKLEEMSDDSEEEKSDAEMELLEEDEEEDEDEDNDYAQSYFDNGEGYGDEDDDAGEGGAEY
ncbi:hypothetical protein BKA69DRAFT_1124464 [Paraphysoderma sedebokerense]|nr:hypothetical protein BKA69DRAFT_1124464 [Paraphysoderma sedebokerense]